MPAHRPQGEIPVSFFVLAPDSAMAAWRASSSMAVEAAELLLEEQQIALQSGSAALLPRQRQDAARQLRGTHVRPRPAGSQFGQHPQARR
jgi:hypothetical protein